MPFRASLSLPETTKAEIREKLQVLEARAASSRQRGGTGAFSRQIAALEKKLKETAMALDGVKHTRRKVGRAAAHGTNARNLTVHVNVRREDGGFEARACVRSNVKTRHGAKKAASRRGSTGASRCGDGSGSSPTIATRRALAALAKRIK